MSMPVISPSTTTPMQALADLLESIALEEAGLAHIINAEGEKIQAAIKAPDVSVANLILVDESVSDLLTKVIKLQMILEFKLEHISDLNIMG